MTSIKKLRVLVAGGGTGGHLFPGISIAEALQSLITCDIRFVGTNRGIEKKIVPAQGYHLYTLPVRGLYRVGFFKKVISLSLLPLAFLKALILLITFRPHLVLGIGGYASGPILALSILLGFKTALQEQNAYPGLTNKLLGKYVPLAFVPFSGMEHLFKNAVVMGNPIRRSIIDTLYEKRVAPKKRFTLTVIGGSQGAHILNTNIVSILPNLEALMSDLKIIHQTGNHDYLWVKNEYKKYPGLDAVVQPFFDNMPDIYQQTSLLFCRAGSMVNEIIAMGIASILVPIAISSGNHQLENAKKMASVQASILLEEKDLPKTDLTDMITKLAANSDKIKKMGQKAFSLYAGNSAEKIAEKIVDFYKFT